MKPTKEQKIEHCFVLLIPNIFLKKKVKDRNRLKGFIAVAKPEDCSMEEFDKNLEEQFG